METYQDYKGYGISYSSITGNTRIDYSGFTLKVFVRRGEIYGLKLAKEYIDSMLSLSEVQNKNI